jgi:hypothetical protein
VEPDRGGEKPVWRVRARTVSSLLRLWIFLQSFRKNAKKPPIYGLLAAKAA